MKASANVCFITDLMHSYCEFLMYNLYECRIGSQMIPRFSKGVLPENSHVDFSN